MAGHTTPYPPDWKQQRRILREQARMQRQAMRAQRHLYRAHVRAMRTGSILTPLVLIAIGIVFLLIETGRLNALAFWTWYGHWWPLLLIGAGVLVLGEWALDRAFTSEDRPLVHRTAGFGLWFLFFLAILTGLAASHAQQSDYPFGILRWASGVNNDTLAEFFGNLHEMDQSVDQNLPAGSSLVIDSPRGGVNISGVSTDGLLHIQLRREIYTNSDSDAQQKAQQLIPHIQAVGKQVTLSLPFIQGTETDMTITVPPTTPLSINTTRGDIDVSAIQAPITLTSQRGNIGIASITGPVNARIDDSGSSFTAHDINGAVTLDTRGRDITITDVTGAAIVRSQAGGSTHLERINGSASYRSDRTQFNAARLDGQFDTNGRYLTVDQALGPVTLTTFSYDITLERIAGNTTISNSNGTVDLVSAPPLGNVSIDNRNGAVTLTVPTHSSFTVEANAANGQIFSDFDSLQQQTHNNHSILSGAIGNAGPILRVSTGTHGDISLRKSDIQPLPATPPAPRPASADAAYPRTPSVADARDQVRQAMIDARQSIQQAREETQQARREAQQAAEEARREARNNQ